MGLIFIFGIFIFLYNYFFLLYIKKDIISVNNGLGITLNQKFDICCCNQILNSI